jgi:hypothetical protein
VPRQPISRIEAHHHIPRFGSHLRTYMHLLSRHTQETHLPEDCRLLFDAVDVFHGIKILRERIDFEEEADDVHETIKATPKGGGRFDTAVVMTEDRAESAGLQGALFYLCNCFY